MSKFLDLREDCDDIIIIKDGFITDTSFSNIVFSDAGQLYTPSTFLLNKVKRQQLLRDERILEKKIAKRI